MRFLIDTNVLVAAAVAEADGHKEARTLLAETVRTATPFCLTWVNVYEYLRVLTHQRIFEHPLSFAQATEGIMRLVSLPAAAVLQETPRHSQILLDLARTAAPVRGNFVHDCHIAALMTEHSVRSIVSWDSHFRRFPNLAVLSPAEAMGLLD